MQKRGDEAMPVGASGVHGWIAGKSWRLDALLSMFHFLAWHYCIHVCLSGIDYHMHHGQSTKVFSKAWIRSI